MHILFLLLLAGEAIVTAVMIHLDMLPIIYLVVAVLVLALVDYCVCRLFFRPGKRVVRCRKLIGVIIVVVLLAGCAVVSVVANDVIKTLEATSQEPPQVATREIYVLQNNKAQVLSDTVGYTFGYVKGFDEASAQQVLEQMSREIPGNYATAGYTNLFVMVKALLNEQIDAMILNGGYIDILEETEGFEAFSQKVRILAQFEVDDVAQENLLPAETIAPEEVIEATEAATVPEETPEQEPEAEESAPKKLQPFLVYVSGSDSHTEMLSSGRSDVNILAAVNPLTKQILLVNTPRDYYVSNTSGGWEKDKLTHCGLYGISCSMNTLGNLYDQTVDYYVQINFTGFKNLIDAMGGITVYSDYAFTAITRTYISEGENHLNGQQALDFARERYTLKGGDNERGRHQMQVIEAAIKKATTGSTIISNYSEIMGSVEGMFTMSIPMELVSDLIKMQLSDMAQWNVVTYSATGYDSSEECFSLPGMELAVIIPDQGSVSKATRLIDMVFAGEFLTEEVMNNIN